MADNNKTRKFCITCNKLINKIWKFDNCKKCMDKIKREWCSYIVNLNR